MARRPVFIPDFHSGSLVEERVFEFAWSSGYAESQKKKNVAALHHAAKKSGLDRILEISTKSNEEVGRRLSAFSLKLKIGKAEYPLESVYQGSKVFRQCGPFPEVFGLEPKKAKRFIRELDCGPLVAFEFGDDRYPLTPKNAFYDWLYIRALAEHAGWISKNVSYDAYTDIEFNPEKQVNCQARAFAEYKSLVDKKALGHAVKNFKQFAAMLPSI